MALAAVAGRTGTLFGMATYAELVPFLFVYAELAWRSLMTFGAGVETHMLRVVEINVTIVCLEYLCLGCRKEQQ